ncbi:hypothetical protein CIL05_20950 [Virgibacillus profundi]|uniref:Uncharacterized protein n=1 Tax=Virgibacillus profundi TaxID=2024555 RepID=A0A2A2I996_9BACI|nr:hypothetical protein [Virgibacillus profundi]PAV27633.1 hypothetical protein CIL05_20950 [Virgibacillus profundi]PXY51811.1 hypothetical protein CIT14_21055 [Virgibacillus profundi]
MVYKFERQAIKNNRGRYSFESIEDWFKRLKHDVNIATYQKVRYGDLEVSEQEIDQLGQQLKEIEQSFKGK